MKVVFNMTPVLYNVLHGYIFYIICSRGYITVLITSESSPPSPCEQMNLNDFSFTNQLAQLSLLKWRACYNEPTAGNTTAP